jgi:hypothetical protein
LQFGIGNELEIKRFPIKCSFAAQLHLLFGWFENSKMTENLLHISKSCRMLQGILQFHAKI